MEQRLRARTKHARPQSVGVPHMFAELDPGTIPDAVGSEDAATMAAVDLEAATDLPAEVVAQAMMLLAYLYRRIDHRREGR